jgi:hypothetical protein
MVSAEIPDQTQFPELCDTVMFSMLHRQCGTVNPNSSCMQDGKFTKRYPRQYTVEEISFNEDGYPLYRRRSNGFATVKGGHEFNNCDVVP